MSPEFDPKKNAANLAKHGVSLADGDGVLLDPLGITVEDEEMVPENLDAIDHIVSFLKRKKG